MLCDQKAQADFCLRFIFYSGTLEVLTISSNTKKNDMLINEEIRDKEVRVVGADGTQLGIMPTKAALELAKKEICDSFK